MLTCCCPKRRAAPALRCATPLPSGICWANTPCRCPWQKPCWRGPGWWRLAWPCHRARLRLRRICWLKAAAFARPVYAAPAWRNGYWASRAVNCCCCLWLVRRPARAFLCSMPICTGRPKPWPRPRAWQRPHPCWWRRPGWCRRCWQAACSPPSRARSILRTSVSSSAGRSASFRPFSTSWR
ncbi:hypothetical protein D3C72_1516060 [compost metagenome]